MVNNIVLIGYVGQDPETKQFENGSSVSKFSIATSESYKDKNDEWVSNTEWHNVVKWARDGYKLNERIKKGALVYVEGKQTSRKVEGETGTKYFSEVVARVARPLEKKEENEWDKASFPPEPSKDEQPW